MENFGQLSQVYAGIYGGLILRTLVFLRLAWVFMNLFRGEVVDRSLHYYFLSPVRREVLVVGKYLSGLIATIVLFSITTVGSMLILYFWLFPSESAGYFFGGAGAVSCCLPWRHDSRVHRLRSRLSDRRSVFPQPDHSGAAAVRLGVDQLFAAAGVEEDERYPLPAVARARADVRRPVRRARRTDAGVDLRAESSSIYRRRALSCEPAHPPNGDQLCRRLTRRKGSSSNPSHHYFGLALCFLSFDIFVLALLLRASSASQGDGTGSVADPRRTIYPKLQKR